jgi:hypothetical protein
MRDILSLFLHLIVVTIRLGQPGGLRSVVAESVLMRHQVLILNRGRKRAPNLRSSPRRSMHSIDTAGACLAVSRRFEDLHSAALS